MHRVMANFLHESAPWQSEHHGIKSPWKCGDGLPPRWMKLMTCLGTSQRQSQRDYCCCCNKLAWSVILVDAELKGLRRHLTSQPLVKRQPSSSHATRLSIQYACSNWSVFQHPFPLGSKTSVEDLSKYFRKRTNSVTPLHLPHP